MTMLQLENINTFYDNSHILHDVYRRHIPTVCAFNKVTHDLADFITSVSTDHHINAEFK